MRFSTPASALPLIVALVFHLQGSPRAAPSESTVIERFLDQPAAAHSYQGARRLEASGSGQRGWLDARIAFTPEDGLSYDVIAEGGSRYIRSRVLRTLLEEERRLIARGGSDAAAISAANYTFADEGIDAQGLARVVMQPLRKERPLIAGRMFLSPDEADLVRVEGRLARNPSFWVSRVDIVRSYRRLNGVRMPVLLESTAQLRLLGRSTLRMTYEYSQIDEQPVTVDGGSDSSS